MQKLGRLLSLIAVLVLGFGTWPLAFAMPDPMGPAEMAAESHALVADMEAAGGDCAKCAGEPGMMQNCLPTCMSAPALAPQEAGRFLCRRASYNSSLEQSFSGLLGRPEPYPPRPITLI